MDKHEEQSTHQLSQILSPDFTFTKRQIGIALLVVGVLGFIGIFALDFVGGGREGGIGPTQQAALAIMALVALVGLSMIPLGDMPA
jgi:hypothetical protein